MTARGRTSFIVVLALMSSAASRAQYVIGEESNILGGEQGFFIPLANGSPPPLPTPTFDLQFGTTTPNDLSDSLTVNSVAMTLALACDAKDVSGTSWTCRDSSGNIVLSEAGTGTSPTKTINAPFHAFDSVERVLAYKAGKRHEAASSTVMNLTTEDLAIEYVGKLSSTSGANIIDKGLAGNEGWRLAQSGTSSIQFQLRTGGVTSSVVSPTGLAASFVHTIAFVDRSEASTNGAIHYANGNAGTGVDFSGRSTSLSNASTMAVGATSGSTANDNTIATVRLWKCSGCFAGGTTNGTQWASIARERAAIAWGIDPTIAAGTRAPTTLTRASTAHIDVVDGNVRHLYLASNNAPRVARRTHSGGTVVSGILLEPSISNAALQSQTLGTTWTAITAGDNVLADAYAGADLTTTGDNIDGNNSSGEHGLRQPITCSSNPCTFSAWAKTGTQSWVALRSAVANGAAWFNVATCTSSTCVVGENCTAAIGTMQAGVSAATAERFPIDTTGDGVADVDLCRVSISTGTGVSLNHDLLCAPSDNALVYTDSDTSADCGFWGVRHDNGYGTPTSYVVTTTSQVARSADDFRYSGTSHYTGSPSTMDIAVLCPSFDVRAQSVFASVGTASAIYARLGIDAANDRGLADATVTTQQWSILASSGDISNGVPHTMRQTMATDNIEAFIDGVSIGTDTLATLPASTSSFIYLSTTGGSTAVAGSSCLLSRARLWSAIVSPAVVP